MKLRWTPNAAEDLESIYVYLREHRPEWAESTIRSLYRTALSLRTMSDRGRTGKMPGTKELVLDRMPYIIVYRISGQVVELIHFNHTSQNRPMS